MAFVVDADEQSWCGLHGGVNFVPIYYATNAIMPLCAVQLSTIAVEEK